MVQPTTKRLVTEASVGGHVLTQITSPGATKDALGNEISTQITTPGTPAAMALNATYALKGDAGPAKLPSPVDARVLTAPDRSPAAKVEPGLSIGVRYNMMEYTEDMTSDRYLTENGATIYPTDTISVAGITLARIKTSNYYQTINTNFNGVGMTNFVVGRRYLLSMYVFSVAATEKFFWMRDRAAGLGNGWGKRLAQPQTLTRVWVMAQAVTTSGFRVIEAPSVGWSATSGLGVKWVNQTDADGNALDFYIGGFQIEDVGTTALDGIAAIGDSTIQGASGTNDLGDARETMAYLEGLLNVNVFNRGIGGNKLTDMDTRWATDITPLKPSCKYVIIQGGINDIQTGASLATMQAAVTSMMGKAKADGFIPVLFTCTPTVGIGAEPAKEAIRTGFNAWLQATYPNVIDVASVVADPVNPSVLRQGGDWAGDGTHYSRDAKRAVAEVVAAWRGWEFATPTGYQKVATASFTPSNELVMVAPDGTKYKLTVANGGALTSTAV